MHKMLSKQLALWMAGQVLPRPSALKPYFNTLFQAIMLSVVSGIALAAAGAAGLALLYKMLLRDGLAEPTATLLIGGIALMAGMICYLLATRQGKKMTSITDELSVFHHTSDQPDNLGELINSIAGAFLAGMKEGQQPAPPPSEKEETHWPPANGSTHTAVHRDPSSPLQ